MATPTSNDVPVSDVAFPADDHTASLVFGVKWGGAVGTGVTLTYSFPEGLDTAYDPDSYPPDDPLFNEWIFGGGWTPLDPTQQANFIDALGSWGNVADITFVLSADNASEVGEIRVAFSELVDHEGAGAWAYLPDPFPYAGDIWINHFYIPETFDEGSWYFNTLVHELGHALGLKHPFDQDGSEVVLAEEFDNIFYTVMTYTDDPSGQGLIPDRYPTTAMVIDILSIQYLYGANDSFHAGDDTYTFDGSGLYFETIWDAGGHDTIVHDGMNGTVIDLRPGGWSGLGQPVLFSTFDDDPVYTDPRTVWIAHDTWIEDAVGGSGDDVIYGNDVENALYGGEGDDILFGAAGDDTLQGGDGDDVLAGGADDDVLDGGAGTDTVDYFDAVSGVTVHLSTPGSQDTLGSGSDSFMGIENVRGSEFDDFLFGTAGRNIMYGGAGGDVVRGGSGNDVLFGEAGVDRLDGNAGRDVLYGGAGDDHLSHTLADANADVMYGGTGNDNYYVTEGDLIFELPNQGIDRVRVDFETTLGENLEWLFLNGDADLAGTGNSLDNVLIGNSGSNVLHGVDGKDQLLGQAGDDTLYGGEGDDVLEGGAGNDMLWGGSGNDYFEPIFTFGEDAGDDTFLGGDGDDRYNMRFDALVIEHENEGLDLIYAYIDVVLPDNVEFLEFDGTANLDGVGNVLDNRIVGNAGNNALSGLDGDDELRGHVGADVLAGAGGNDVLKGGAGNDVLDGGADSDTIWGEDGDDLVLFDSSDAGVVNGGSGTDTLRLADDQPTMDITGGSNANIQSFEIIDLAGSNILILDAVSVVALSSSDTLVVTGGDGDEVRAGGSWVFGELVNIGGSDFRHYTAAGATLLVQSGVLFTAVEDETNVDDPGEEDMEPVIFAGTPDDDEIDGSPFADQLTGRAGNDLFRAGAGDDSLIGNAGNDALFGAAGNDVLKGGGGSDVLDGGAGDDLLIGGSGNDILDGADGNDIYRVTAAHAFPADVISDSGGSGEDVLDASRVAAFELAVSFHAAGTGLEVITGDVEGGSRILAGGMDVTWNFSGIELRHIPAITGSAGDDFIVGSAGADTILGRGGADTLAGGDSKDVLNGQNGADTLSGGAGKDTLTGGKGADTFHFDAPLDGLKKDTVTDFGNGADVLELDAGVFTALAGSTGGTLDAGNFRANNKGIAKDVDDFLVYNKLTGQLYYDADGNGAGAAIKIAILDGAPVLQADDILISG